MATVNFSLNHLTVSSHKKPEQKILGKEGLFDLQFQVLVKGMSRQKLERADHTHHIHSRAENLRGGSTLCQEDSKKRASTPATVCLCSATSG